MNIIKEELLLLPERIYELELKLLAELTAINDLEHTRKELERETFSKVESEVDTEGKKVYSNQQKREIETKLRLKSNESYNKIVDKKFELEDNKKKQELLLEREKRKFRAYEAFSRLGE